MIRPPPLAEPNRALLIVGLAITVPLVVLAIIGAFWTPFPIAEMDLTARLMPPGPNHLLGTDHLGRDLMSLLISGHTNGHAAAATALFGAAVLGVPLGVLATGRIAATILTILGEVLLVLPALVGAALIASVFGPSLWAVTIVLGLGALPFMVRVVRKAIVGRLTPGLVEASRLAGREGFGIVFTHGIRAVPMPLLAAIFRLFAIAVMAEASLSYLGLGAQPPQVSLGTMWRDGQVFMGTQPLVVLLPTLLLFLSVLAFSLLARAFDAPARRLRHAAA